MPETSTQRCGLRSFTRHEHQGFSLSPEACGPGQPRRSPAGRATSSRSRTSSRTDLLEGLVALAGDPGRCDALHSGLVRYLARGFENEATVGTVSVDISVEILWRSARSRARDGVDGGGYDPGSGLGTSKRWFFRATSSPTEWPPQWRPGSATGRRPGMALAGLEEDHVGFRERGERRALCHYPGIAAGRLGHVAACSSCAGTGGSDRGQKRR